MTPSLYDQKIQIHDLMANAHAELAQATAIPDWQEVSKQYHELGNLARRMHLIHVQEQSENKTLIL